MASDLSPEALECEASGESKGMQYLYRLNNSTSFAIKLLYY